MNEKLTTEDDLIVIKVADCNREKRQAYQLRYEVFALELNDQRYADHDLQEFKDTDDVDESILIIAKSKNRVIGSVRLKPLMFRDFIGVEDYGFERLAEFLEFEPHELLLTVAAVDRFVFAKDSRKGRSLCRRLLDELECQAKALGVNVLVAAVDSEDARLRVFYRRFLGYKEYPVARTRDGVRFQCFYGLLNGISDGSDVRD